MKIFKLNLIFSLTILLTMPYYANSQHIEDQNLNNIMSEVDNIYKGNDKVEGMPKYKHFVRWAYWWSSRVNPDGTFPDVKSKNETAIQQLEKLNSHSNRSLNEEWSFIGPDISTYSSNASHCKGNGYGRLDRVAFHPSNANIVYTGGPSGGLWRTDDGGSTWDCLTDNLPNISVAGIAVSPDNPNEVFLLSGTSDNTFGDLVTSNGYFLSTTHVYHSSDEGQNWKVNYEFPDSIYQAFRLKQHPSDSDLLVAATDKGLFRTEDGGSTWDLEVTGSFTDIEFHPTHPDTIYASGFGIYRYSFDRGVTWNSATGITFCFNGQGDPFRSELAVSADDNDDVWLLCGPGQNNTANTNDAYCGLYHSTNHGQSFTLRNNTPDVLGRYNASGPTYSDQSNYDLCIDVNPNDESKLVIGALAIWRNTNSGSGSGNWTNTGPYWEATGSQQGTTPSNYVHPDVHDVEYNPLDGKVYTCSDGGIYVSSDDGLTWTNITAGIHTSQIYNINIAPTNSIRIAAGLQDNGVKVRTSTVNQDFKHVYQADGFDVSFSPSSSSTLALSINNSEKYVTTSNYGTRITLPNTGNAWYKPIRFKPGSNDSIYVGSNPLRIYKVSTNNTTQMNGTTNSSSWEIHTCNDNPNQIYTAGGSRWFRNDTLGSFYTSFDSGLNFLDRSTTQNFPDTMIKITDIATVPSFCNQVAFSMGGYVDGKKVYYSSTSGNGWFNISYNLPNVPVHSLEYDNDGTLYAGTEIGVFVKKGNSSDWLPFTNGLPRVPVSDLIKNGSKIIASTFGRGVWEADLYTGNCVVNETVDGDLIGDGFYEVSGNINSSATIKGGVGTEVYFHSGQSLKLLPGFNVTSHSKFKGKITPCGTLPEN